MEVAWEDAHDDLRYSEGLKAARALRELSNSKYSMRYRDGVEVAAAKASLAAKTKEQAMRLIVRTFAKYRDQSNGTLNKPALGVPTGQGKFQ